MSTTSPVCYTEIQTGSSVTGDLHIPGHALAVIGGGQPCLASTQSPSHNSASKPFLERSTWGALALAGTRPTPRVLLPGSDPVGPAQVRRGRQPSHETGQPGGNRPAGSLARASTPGPNNDASSLDTRHHLSELWLMLLHQPLVAHRHLCWSRQSPRHPVRRDAAGGKSRSLRVGRFLDV